MSQLIMNAIVKMICTLICQFCDCCEEDKNCPDGVCNKLRRAAANLDSVGPPAVAAQPASPNFSWNWDVFRDLVEKLTEAIELIQIFFGRDNTPVGATEDPSKDSEG